jgi:hypothetical protein
VRHEATSPRSAGRTNGWTAEDNRRQNERRAKVRAVIEAAKCVPCADCGQEFPPVVMDFDHRGESQKTVKIADWPRRVGCGRKAVELLKAEIEACDIVCANCHRLRHADEMAGEWRGSRSSKLVA